MSNTQQNNSSKPTHGVFAVERLPQDSERKPFWNRVGSAWYNTDKGTMRISRFAHVAEGFNEVIAPLKDKD